ncbi:DUF6781 family protein [Nitrosophilus kaiyonis]|uniref:DUF6781 family protein n=1 Tax=Nitrosophilus kaiyonis TaxID=2930200 RepID=UPI002493987C|nr:DUF6781 family protein [Nitrosophilus kaiyonis]
MQELIKKAITKEDLEKAVSTIIEDIKSEKEKKIEELISEIDKINREIEHEKEDLKNRLNDAFKLLENLAQELEDEKRYELIKIIEKNKLKSLEFLGILKETTEAAFITAIEKNEDLEETIKEITKNLTFETIDTKVDKEHIEDVAKTILQVASEIASVSINYSDEILRGTIFGVKEGISKSIEKFKESIEFTPIEARELVFENYDKIVKDLENIDQIYISCIKDIAYKSDAGIKEKILEISKELESVIYRLKHEAQNAINIFKIKFSDFTNEAKSTTSIFKEKAEDAKKLGLRVFEMAKAAINGAIKGAKEAINKEKNEK